MFGLLADIEGFYRTVVPHHPRPDLTRLAFGVIQADLCDMCFVSVHSFAPFFVEYFSLSGDLPGFENLAGLIRFTPLLSDAATLHHTAGRSAAHPVDSRASDKWKKSA